MGRIGFLLVTGLPLIVGIWIGLSLNRIPLVSLDPQVGLAELGNAVMVLVLALTVPFLLTRRIDNQRNEKNLLIDEIRVFYKSLEEIDKLLMGKCGQELSQDSFREVIFLFKKSKMQFAHVEDQLGESFSKARNQTIGQINDALGIYWVTVTGNGGITPSGFQVTHGFVVKQAAVFENTARAARKLQFQVNDF